MPENLERSVDKVKAQKGIDSAYTICNASLNEDNQTIEETVNKQIIEASLQRSCKCQKKIS